MMNLELWLIRGLIFIITRYYKYLYVHSCHIELMFIPNPHGNRLSFPFCGPLTSWGLGTRHHRLGDLGTDSSPLNMEENHLENRWRNSHVLFCCVFSWPRKQIAT